DLRVSMAESLWQLRQHRAAMDLLVAVLSDFPRQPDALALFKDYLDELPTPALSAEYRSKIK
ncbi:MAG: hypothetical protein KDC87_01355, partial [Planctomycetes bacterium]|nr:hypothetical protein [Planctomycetota bacterium]